LKEVVVVKHREYGHVGYYDPKGKQYRTSEIVIIDVDKTKDCGKVLIGNHEVEDNFIKEEIPSIIRATNAFDMKKIEENEFREKKAFSSCVEYINTHSMPMKLIAVEYSFDRKKLRFFFTSNKKVDFRELVKELVEEFKTGVELRQIGVRDASKILGALGICGRVVCCHSFLDEFKAVNLKMARSQNVMSSPEKISGVCGRLRCCLHYECDGCSTSGEEEEIIEE